MGRGRFITFEGGDGTGKSTQVGRLAKRLEARGISVQTTREPGGSLGAEQIRSLLVTGKLARWDAMTEALLFTAARRNHLETLIKPALQKGTWVVSDRFSDSTMAYQGIAGGLGEGAIDTLNKTALGDFEPDLTLVLDLAIKIGLERSGGRNADDGKGEDRFERKGGDFHKRLREAFLEIASDNPERCIVIDAGGTVDEVEEKVWRAVKDRFF